MASIGRLVRGGAYLYLSSIVNNLSGYAYWLIISGIAGPEILGLTSAVVGLSALVTGALSLGIPMALQRNLGECLGRGDEERLRQHYWTATIFQTLVYLAAATTLYTLAKAGLAISNYTPQMLQAAAALVILNGIGQLPAANLVARLETKTILVAALAGNTVKLGLGIGLVALGYGWTGAVTGYLAQYVIALAIAKAVVVRRTKPALTLNPRVLVETLRAGIPAWLPGFILILGQWLSVIAVFGYKTATETGHYYAAYAIASFLTASSTIVLGVLLPVLAGMTKGQESLAANAIRIALALITPLAIFTAAYPKPILSLLGPEYQDAATALTILALTAPITIITATVANLAYAKAHYKLILTLGLAQTLPRITLYPILTPTLGATGAASAIMIGSLVGLTLALLASKAINYSHPFIVYAKILMVPVIIVLSGLIFHLPAIMVFILNQLSYIAYAKLRLITRKDAREIARAFLATETIDKLYTRLRPLLSLIFPSD